ncbi:hypothetical protein BMETH_1071801950713, partial [methanotrophic bacterial endosymbiont of Bathymodiolus sp.]
KTFVVFNLVRDRGNTPTGVGKTNVADQNRLLFSKHPHGRGEDLEMLRIC